MWQHLRLIGVVTLLLSSWSAGAIPSPRSTTCREIARLLRTPGSDGIANSIIYGESVGGYDVYQGLDLDRDGQVDKVAKSCSASIVPADPCILEVELTSGKKYEVEAWRMYLINFDKNTYVVTSDLEVSGKRASRSILLLGRSGARRICAGL